MNNILPNRMDSVLKFISKSAINLSILLSLILVGYFILIMDRGFEISDESYYMLLAMHSKDVKLFVSAQHWITPILWTIAGSLTGFRTIGFVIILFTAFLLAIGIIHAYTSISESEKFTQKNKILIIATTLSGAMLYGATINFSPCYNLLASAGAYAAVGLVLFSIGKPAKWHLYVIYILSGCAIGIVFLNKATAGLAILFLVIALIAFIEEKIKRKIIGIILIIFGMIALIVAVSFPHALKNNIIDEINLGLAVFKQVQVESNTFRILRYIYEFLSQLFFSGVIFIAPVIYLSIFRKSNQIEFYTIITLFCIILFACISLTYAFSINRWGGIATTISTILTISILLNIDFWIKNFKTLILTVALIVMPYCVAFGSGNNIQTQIVVALASWGAVIAIFGIATKPNIGFKVVATTTGTLFVLVICIQIMYSSYHPYHLNTSIWKQKIPTKIGNIGVVKTDKATSEFVFKLTQSMEYCKIANNRPYLGFYEMPGVALVINGIPVFSPWLTNASQSELILNKANSNILKSAVIGIQLRSNGTLPKLPEYFSDFPKGYKKCGEATYPYKNERIQIWVPEL